MPSRGYGRSGQGGTGSNASSGSSTGVGGTRGPRHGHGRNDSGGGRAYGGNPTGLTISEAMTMYGATTLQGLQQSMSYNPANTIDFYSLIDDSEFDEGPEDIVGTDPTTTTTTNTMTTETFDINNLYQMIFGRDADAGGRDYWTDQYQSMRDAGTSHADAVRSIKQHLVDSQERTDLGFSDNTVDFITDNPWHARHSLAALDSVDRGGGVRRGSVAAYSDIFDEDGNQRDDWVDIETWNQNTIESLQDTIAYMEDNPTIEYVDREVEVAADTSGYEARINDLQASLNDMTAQNAELSDLYNTAQTGFDDLYAAAAYGERPRNTSVRGVRTQNELPGYFPRRQGTRFFNRDTPGSGLTTASLNLA